MYEDHGLTRLRIELCHLRLLSWWLVAFSSDVRVMSFHAASCWLHLEHWTVVKQSTYHDRATTATSSNPTLRLVPLDKVFNTKVSHSTKV